MLCRHLRLDLDAEPFDATSLVAHAVSHGPAARVPAGRSHVTTPVKAASRKMGRSFAVDSPGEADALALADVLEDVEAYRPQAVELRFTHDGRPCRAYPDLALLAPDGTAELWEVKPERRDDALIRRLASLSRALRSHGIRYRVRTSFWLRRAHRQENARRIGRLAGRPLPAGLRDGIGSALGPAGGTTLGQLGRVLGVGAADLLAASARGWLAVDLDGGVLGGQTLVRRAKPGAVSGGYLGAEEEKA